MGSKQEFVDFIKEELSKRNWSHAELSRRSGVSQAHISRVIKGNYQPGLDFYKSISSAFDTPEELIFRISGELPERQEIEPIREKIISKFIRLTDEDQELVVDFIQFLINRKK